VHVVRARLVDRGSPDPDVPVLFALEHRADALARLDAPGLALAVDCRELDPAARLAERHTPPGLANRLPVLVLETHSDLDGRGGLIGAPVLLDTRSGGADVARPTAGRRVAARLGGLNDRRDAGGLLDRLVRHRSGEQNHCRKCHRTDDLEHVVLLALLGF